MIRPTHVVMCSFQLLMLGDAGWHGQELCPRLHVKLVSWWEKNTHPGHPMLTYVDIL